MLQRKKQMDKLTWSDSYSVNNKVIDDEHRTLLSIISRMEKLVEDGGDSLTMSTLLTEMSDYAIKHFRSEEQYMQSISYPKVDEHRELHSTYSIQVLKFTLNHLSENPNRPAEVLEFLKDWWTAHIVDVDSDYALYARTSASD